MTHRYRISRRTMLRGSAAAVSLPLLDIMANPAAARTDQAASPTRLAYLYFPNGVSEGSWDPERTGRGGKLERLNEWMSPLEHLKDHLLIPRNVWTPEGNGHAAGTATWLTGHDYDSKRIDAGGRSADQIAAVHCGKQTLLPSLELSTKGEGFFSKSLVRNSLSWVDAGHPMPREYEPRVIFDRMFRTEATTLSNRAVLDQVLEDARGLKRAASEADRRKIDEYLEAVRSVERRLQFSQRRTMRPQSAGLPIRLERPAADVPDDHEQYMRLMLDMVTLAFWADATRVCTFMLDHGQSNRYFNFIDGVRGTWHALSHWRDASGDTEDDDGVTSWSSAREKQQMYNEVVRWHHRQVAYFIDNLKRIEEDEANLLHHSMLVYGSSLADGHMHEASNLPLLVAGAAGGRFETGRLVRYRQPTSMSQLHLAALQNLGAPAERFGEADQPLAALSPT